MLFLGLVAFGALALGLRVAVIETDLEQLWVEGELLELAVAALVKDREGHLLFRACVSGCVAESLPLSQSPSVLWMKPRALCKLGKSLPSTVSHLSLSPINGQF